MYPLVVFDSTPKIIIRTAILELRQKDRLTEQQYILIVGQQGCERHSKINNRIDDSRLMGLDFMPFVTVSPTQ